MYTKMTLKCCAMKMSSFSIVVRKQLLFIKPIDNNFQSFLSKRKTETKSYEMKFSSVKLCLKCINISSFLSFLSWG